MIGRILCLHYVAAGATRRRLALPVDRLRSIVEREVEGGRRPATLREAVSDPSCFALTFDDAHRSLRTLAMPLLRELGVPGSVFVPTGWVGTSDEVLDWDDLRALRDAGWTIGSHSHRHDRASLRFYDENEAAHALRLRVEAERSRDLLEQKLGVRVHDYAYPYGETTPMACEAVRRAGYERAYTVRDALAWDSDPLTIPRLDGQEAHGVVAPRSVDPTPISVVVPARDRHDMLTEIVARWSAQSYPPECWEVLVVDDGSGESLARCFEGAAENVRLVERASDGRFRAGEARQHGASLARFDTLAFVDADVAVGRDYLWHLDWIHQRVDDVVVLGSLSGYNLHDLGHRHTLDDLRALSPEAELPVIPDRSREPMLRSCFDNLDWLEEPWRLCYTGNLSLSRRLLSSVGGFSSSFSGWGLEDLELGLRLHRHGAPFVFSRFAIGHHLVDVSEGAPRNPFRASSPVRELFVGYERNLERLVELHPNEASVVDFVRQAHEDIAETCGRPDSVGVELGGGCSLECPFHRRLHRCQPGDTDRHELQDRVAYAQKVGARSLYLLGGDPADHPDFLALLREARAAGLDVVTETTALPFARPELAEQARDAGLAHVVVEVLSLDSGTFDAATRSVGRFVELLDGLGRLAAAGVSMSARVVVTSDTEPALEATIGELSRRAIAIDEVVVLDETHRIRAEQSLRAAGISPPVRVVEAREP